MKRVHTDSIAFCRFKRFYGAHASFLTCSLQVFVRDQKYLIHVNVSVAEHGYRADVAKQKGYAPCFLQNKIPFDTE